MVGLNELHLFGVPVDDLAALDAQVREQGGAGGTVPKTASSTTGWRDRTEAKKFLKWS